MPSKALRACEQWVEKVVIAYGLCPFAAPVVKNKQLIYVESLAGNEAQYFQDFLQTLQDFVQANPADVSTCLLVFSSGLRQFDDYLAFLSLAEDALEEVGLTGVVQLASFHPEYVFEGSTDLDPANFSNRSPYPMLHYLREAALEKALDSYPEPELIPERNMHFLRTIGLEKLARQLADFTKDQ